MEIASIHKCSALWSAGTFLTTLYVATYTHYADHVKTHVAKFPDEWFSSVSAVIGDYYPARSIFQIGMALTATFRFLSIHHSHGFTNDNLGYFFDILKTLAIGGMAYITSTDDMNVHSASMIVYVVATIGSIYRRSRKSSKLSLPHMLGTWMLVAYISNLGIMSWHLYRHNVYRIPGAYSWYAVFEWILPAIDIFADYITSMKGCSETNVTEMLYSAKQSLQTLPSLWSSIVFWTNLTGLPLTLWYFPLWELGLSGYEVSLIAFLSPILLSNARVRELVTRNEVILSLLTGCGITFGRVELLSPPQRLGMVSLATAASMLQWFAKLGKHDQQQIEHRYTLMQGLFFTVALKWMNFSINPLWSTVQWTLPSTVTLWNFHVMASFGFFVLHVNTKQRKREKQEEEITQPSFTKAFAFGASLFLTHSFATDANAFMFRLAPPAPEGNIVLPLAAILMMTTGIDMDLNAIHFLTPSVILICQVIPTGIKSLDVCKWMFAHIVVANKHFSGVSAHISSPLHMGSAFGLYLGLLFADVLTVGYAFVPVIGGFFREGATMVFLLPCIIQSIPLFMEKAPTAFRASSRNNLSDKFAPFKQILLMVLGLSACIQGYLQNNREKMAFKPSHDKNVLTTGIWTVHFGLDDDMYLSYQNMTNMIKKLDLDVVGLLESDTMHNVGGNRNLLQYMASHLHMEAVYGPVPKDSTWGCSLLSRYPVIKSTSYLLPSPVGELACAIHATIKTPHMELDVFVSHNGQEEDWEDRKLQTAEIARILRGVNRPVIFMGYLVTKPGLDQPLYNMMISDGRMTDILSTDRQRWCEYVMYRDLLPLAYARISHGRVTDTELQSAKFWIGNNSTFIQMNDNNMYPPDFEGDGWNGHKYNVFSAPIYDPLDFDARRRRMGL